VSFKLLGIVLLVIGLFFGLFFYFVVDSVPLVAVGLSMVILGVMSIGLASVRPYISPEAWKVLFTTGVVNTTGILEDFKIRNRAIYLPRCMSDGPNRAIIPINGESRAKDIQEKLPHFTVNRGPNQEDTHFSVATPGNLSLDLLPRRPGPTQNGIKKAIEYILNRVLDLAVRVKISHMGSHLHVIVTGAEINYDEVLYYQCVGSPIASIAAAISSEALEKPVQIIEETNKGKTLTIILEVLS
jgi:hypothetical protein